MNDIEVALIKAMLYLHECRSPSLAIENQERRGQEDVVRNQYLPRKMNDFRVSQQVEQDIHAAQFSDEWWEIRNERLTKLTVQMYEKMGITVNGEHDDLFFEVTLPDGWCIRATDHTMWNELVDDKGQVMAQFFYKASLYNRKAFINFIEVK